MCKVYTGYCSTSEIEYGLFACTVDNPLAKARGLSFRTGAQTMLYLSLILYSLQCKIEGHAYGTPEGTFLFKYFTEKKSKQKELERKSKQ